MVTRRALIAAALAAAGCGRPRAPRYFGWLFIASAAERALAVADLSSFHRVASIPLPSAPAQVFRVGKKVFVSCPDGHTLYEIDPETFRIAGKVAFPGRIAGSAVCADGTRIAVLVEQPAAVHVVESASRRVLARIALPGSGSLIDATNDLAALATSGGILRISLRSFTILGGTELGFKPGIVRLHDDAKLMLVGASDRSEIVTVSSESGAILARLPLAFIPRHFCFNLDGGQMFVTGSTGDEMAIVSPYQSEVDQTIVAGRTPMGMAVGARNGVNLLFITNPGSGDLTVFDYDQRSLVSSVHVGGEPGEVLLTLDGEYALAIDRVSGDVAVVHIRTLLDRQANEATAPRVKPLFTVFATGADPQSATIVPEQRQG